MNPIHHKRLTMKHPKRCSGLSLTFARAAVTLVVGACLLAPQIAAAAGFWTPLNSGAPDQVGVMLLLPDGTVMAANANPGHYFFGGAQWFRLTPDAYGHYVNGSWSTRQTAAYSRTWFASQVLQNGKVLVAGGEYGSGGNTAELYDPISDYWFPIPVPDGLICTNCSGDAANSGFRDPDSVLLPNGTVLIAPVYPYSGNDTIIYDPVANTLSVGPTNRLSQDEAGWVKLPDGSILSADHSNGAAERFIPSLNKWIADFIPPVFLYSYPGDEEGAALLLPNSNAFFLGGTGHTLIYTPSGSTSKGSWVAGPDIPQGLTAPDAGAAMMVNGKILVAACPPPTSQQTFNPPTSFFEYDYSDGPIGSFTQVASPTGGLTDNIAAYQALMLALPDGTILYSHFGTDLYVYTPDGSPLAAGKPTIASVRTNGDGSYHVTGTLFNGISQGAAYGDDAQMNTDYPLVELLDNASHVTFARTSGWSGTTVMTGTNIVSTEFDGERIAPGAYSLRVVVNGIASDTVPFYGPVWVDFNSTNSPQNGLYATPFSTLAQATNAVVSGGIITIKSSTSHEKLRISKPMLINAAFGAATVGK